MQKTIGPTFSLVLSPAVAQAILKSVVRKHQNINPRSLLIFFSDRSAYLQMEDLDFLTY